MDGRVYPGNSLNVGAARFQNEAVLGRLNVGSGINQADLLEVFDEVRFKIADSPFVKGISCSELDL